MAELLLTTIILILLFIIMALLPSKYFQVRVYSKEVVETWAKNEGFRISCVEQRYFVPELHFWIASRTQHIYYIEGRDITGNEKKGYIRFTNKWYSRMTLDSIQVLWL